MLVVLEAVKKFLEFYVTAVFINVSTTAHNLPHPELDESIPFVPSFIFTIPFYTVSRLCLGPRSGRFPQPYPQRPWTHFSSPPMRATCPTHFIFEQLNTSRKQYKYGRCDIFSCLLWVFFFLGNADFYLRIFGFTEKVNWWKYSLYIKPTKCTLTIKF